MTSETPTVKLPVPMARDERIVERSFWRKLRRVAGRIPFAEDAAAAYFCAVDPKTPPKVRAILFAALAYFVLPFDLIPSFIIVLIGFTSDAAVIALALSVVGANITEEHRAKARAALDIAPPA